MAKVLLVIGDAAEVFDTLYPLHRIREDGYEVLVGGPEKRVYHLVQHDRHPDWDITVESPGYKLAAGPPSTSATITTCSASSATCTKWAGRSARSATASRSSPPPASSRARP